MQREPRHEEKTAETRKDATERKRRFRIVKLEERIAPGGGNGNGNGSHYCRKTHGNGCGYG